MRDVLSVVMTDANRKSENVFLHFVFLGVKKTIFLKNNVYPSNVTFYGVLWLHEGEHIGRWMKHTNNFILSLEHIIKDHKESFRYLLLLKRYSTSARMQKATKHLRFWWVGYIVQISHLFSLMIHFTA